MTSSARLVTASRWIYSAQLKMVDDNSLYRKRPNFSPGPVEQGAPFLLRPPR